MIGRSSERWSGISVLAARHDDDDDDDDDEEEELIRQNKTVDENYVVIDKMTNRIINECTKLAQKECKTRNDPLSNVGAVQKIEMLPDQQMEVPVV